MRGVPADKSAAMMAPKQKVEKPMRIMGRLFGYILRRYKLHCLGVLLFILKSIDKNAEKEEKAAAQAQADYRSDLGPASAQTAPRQENEPAYGHDVPTKEQKDAKERHKLLTTLCTIGGAVFLFAGFSTTASWYMCPRARCAPSATIYSGIWSACPSVISTPMPTAIS